MLIARGICIGSKTRVIFPFLGLRSELVSIIRAEVCEKDTCGLITCGMNNRELD